MLKHVTEEYYIYFWDFENDNKLWILGQSPTSSVHSLEIVKPSATNSEICVDQLEDAEYQVWTQNEWVQDASLTINCIDPDFKLKILEGITVLSGRRFFRSNQI